MWNDAPLQERYEREDPFLERIYFGPYWKLVFLELGSEGLNCLKCPLLFSFLSLYRAGRGGFSDECCQVPLWKTLYTLSLLGFACPVIL